MDKSTEYAMQLLAALALKKEYPMVARDDCMLTPERIKELAVMAFPAPKKGKKK